MITQLVCILLSQKIWYDIP